MTRGPLTFEMDTPRDLLTKARRERDRLEHALSVQDKLEAGDALFNFAVTAFHVKDWVKHSGVTPAAEKVESYVNQTPALEGCRAVCHSGKHFELDDPSPDVVEVAVSAARAVIVVDRSGNAVLESSAPWRLKVVFSDGSRVEALEFADQVIAGWEAFFSRYGL